MEALWLLAAPLTVNLLRLPERAQLAEGGACEEVWLNTVAMGLLLGTEDTRGDWTKCSSEEVQTQTGRSVIGSLLKQYHLHFMKN